MCWTSSSTGTATRRPRSAICSMSRWGVYEVTQKKDTLVLQVEQLDLRMIQGLLVSFNGRVVTGAGAKPYLSVTLQKEEKPLELLQSILRAMQDILKD